MAEYCLDDTNGLRGMTLSFGIWLVNKKIFEFLNISERLHPNWEYLAQAFVEIA